MSVKSTITLSRAAAETRMVDLWIGDQELIRTLKAKAVILNNEELENELERVNDKNCGGESFNNYNISNGYDGEE